MASGMRLRKGDEVMVITGKDRGKRGRVQEVRPRDRTVIVAGVNIAKHHTKANPTKNQKGGIIEQPMPLGLGKVMVVCLTAGSPRASPIGWTRTPRSACASTAARRSSWRSQSERDTASQGRANTTSHERVSAAKPRD